MKSENKLQTIIRNLDVLSTYSNTIDQTDLIKDCQKLLQEFIVDNSKINAGKFDLSRYTADDETRPLYNGIIHDTINKCAFATDAHILVVDRATYDPTVEERFKDQLDIHGCVAIDKYGNRIEGNSPAYNRVFPTDEQFDRALKYQITAEELAEYIKRAKAYMKVHELSTKYYRIRYKVGSFYFDAQYLLSFVVASEGNVAIHAFDDVSRSGEVYHLCRAIWYTNDRKCLLMPLYITEKDEKEFVGTEEGLYIYH